MSAWGAPAQVPEELLQYDEAGRLAVVVTFSAAPSESQLAEVTAVGVVGTVSAEFATVSAFIDPAQADWLRGRPGVTAVTPSIKPEVGRMSSLPGASLLRTLPADALHPAAHCREIPVEADGPLGTAEARLEFGVDGTGVTVGIISDSFDASTESVTTPDDDIALGSLPGPGNPCGYIQPVEVVKESPSGADEGRAMAQLVHGVAPGARLLFATGGSSMYDMADSIRQLAAAGADVIVDDLTYFSEPMFQAGPVDQAISEVRAQGIAYFSSAANFNVNGPSGPLVSWETEAYRPMPCPPETAALPVVLADCMDFDPGPGQSATNAITANTGSDLKVLLQWADPMFGVGSPVFPILFDEVGDFRGPIPMDSDSPSLMALYPGVGRENGEEATFQLVLGRAEVRDDVRVKYILAGARGVTDVQFDRSEGGDVVGPSIMAHNGAEGTVSVASAPYDNPAVPRDYTALGPVTHVLAPVDGRVPAARLPEPLTLAKPDVTAVDGTQTSFFTEDDPGVYRFFGTSAAAPHAAAVYALAKQWRPDLSVEQLLAAMASTATPLASPYAGWPAESVTGAGLVDSVAWLTSIPRPVVPADNGEITRLPSAGAEPLPVLAIAIPLLLAGVILLRRRPARG